MRPVNTAFMYEGERANPSVHSSLTSHLKGHLILINDLVSRRRTEKPGCRRAKKSERSVDTMLTYLLNSSKSISPSLAFGGLKFGTSPLVPRLLPPTLRARRGSCGAGRHRLKRRSMNTFIPQSGSERQEMLFKHCCCVERQLAYARCRFPAFELSFFFFFKYECPFSLPVLFWVFLSSFRLLPMDQICEGDTLGTDRYIAYLVFILSVQKSLSQAAERRNKKNPLYGSELVM